MKLWLDDIRLAPPGWQHVRTVEEAKFYLSTGLVTYLSLDHDLGTCLTGYDLVCWMEETGHWPTEGIMVHSMNPVGKERMLNIIYRSCPVSLMSVHCIDRM